MDVIRREEIFLDRGVGIGEVAPQVEHAHVGIAVELQRIKGVVGLLDVFVEAIAGSMRRQDLRDDDRGSGKLVAQILHAHLNALRRGFDPRFGREEHIVVSDHEQNELGLQTFNATMIESPQNVLSLIATDADVHRFAIGKVLLPRIAPLDRNTVANQQHVAWSSVLFDMLDQLGMRIKPTRTAPVSSRWHHGPHRGQVLVRFSPRPPLVFGT